MTATTITPGIQAIIDATVAFNAQHGPEAAAEIASATPVVDVTWSADSTGRRVTITVTPGVLFDNGEVAFGAEGTVFGPVRVFDGRDTLGTARWAARKAYDIPAGVLVRYFAPRRTAPVHTETA
ncbi:hypothetical protein [Micromonospora aurantiaca (nom. illeg.)]|uniref:hypothetical protein n=1 Tax=Micromonospora aurantiaca (nom. illeg.) TaxID=47850 RepID=UPI0011A5CE2F|nr:hypothetical protein [Micromonospora aurantiaca]MBC9000541.1 hypothetical protein [Micromonospora aurantiaca]